MSVCEDQKRRRPRKCKSLSRSLTHSLTQTHKTCLLLVRLLEVGVLTDDLLLDLFKVLRDFPKALRLHRQWLRLGSLLGHYKKVGERGCAN